MSIATTVLVVPSIVLLIGAVLAFLLQRSSASLRHQVWALAVFSAALIPAAVVVLPKWEIPVLRSSNTTMVVQHAASSPAMPVEARALPETGTSAGVPLPLPQARVGFEQAMFWVWLLGSGIVVTRFVLGIFAVVRLTRNSKIGCFPEVGELRSQLAIHRKVRVRVARRSFAPMTWGSVILLPEESNSWTAERRYLVLAHELAHVKRHDGLLHMFVQLIAALYWFNPLIWLAVKCMRIEREKSCDDIVLNLGADSHAYASHLIEVARRLSRSDLSLAAVSMAHPSQLETRILAIMDSRTRRRPMSNFKILVGYFSVAIMVSLFSTLRVTATAVMTPILAPPIVEVEEPVVPIAESAQAPALPVRREEQVIPEKETEPSFQYHFYGATDPREQILAQYGRPDSFYGVTQASQVWTYRHIPGVGDNVRFEFVDPSGTGEYRLTAPFTPAPVQFEQAKWAGTWKLNKDRSTFPAYGLFKTTFSSIDSAALQLVPVPGGVTVTSEVSIIPPGEPAGSSRRSETRTKFTVMFGEIVRVSSIIPFIDQNGTVLFQATADGLELTATSGTPTSRLVDVIRLVVSDDGRTLSETINTVPGVIGVLEKQ